MVYYNSDATYANNGAILRGVHLALCHMQRLGPLITRENFSSVAFFKEGVPVGSGAKKPAEDGL